MSTICKKNWLKQDKKSIYSNKSNDLCKIKSTLNIKNLFPMNNTISSQRPQNASLDINTLFGCNNYYDTCEKAVSFSSEILIDRIVKRRKEKLKCYRKVLLSCHNKIIDIDDSGVTDMYFNIKRDVVDFNEIICKCNDFKYHECIEYISDILRDDYFDTLIVNNQTLFISWHNIELKKEEKKNEKITDINLIT
jgi:hypothetical protein